VGGAVGVGVGVGGWVVGGWVVGGWVVGGWVVGGWVVGGWVMAVVLEVPAARGSAPAIAGQQAAVAATATMATPALRPAARARFLAMADVAVGTAAEGRWGGVKNRMVVNL
jgi:hypothetical protein